MSVELDEHHQQIFTLFKEYRRSLEAAAEPSIRLLAVQCDHLELQVRRD